MFFYCVRILLFFCLSAFVFKVGGVNYQKRPSCRAIWIETTNISPKSSNSFVHTLNLLPKDHWNYLPFFLSYLWELPLITVRGSYWRCLFCLRWFVIWLSFFFFLPYLSIKNKPRPFWLFWQRNNLQFKKPKIYHEGSVLHISKSALANHQGESNFITKCSQSCQSNKMGFSH